MLERRADLGGREHVFAGMAAISPDFVLAVGRGGVSVEDGVRNIFHRCFKFKLFHFDDDRDLHRQHREMLHWRISL